MNKNIKKIIFFSIIIFSMFLMLQNNISADVSGTGGTGGSSVDKTSGQGTWSSRFGFYIKVYGSDNKQKGSIKDVYIGSYASPSIDALKGWITYSSSTWSSHPEKLYNYLKIPYGNVSGDYSTLLNIVNTTLVIGDYIIIEPYTYIDDEKYTFRKISDSTKKYNKCTKMKCNKYECSAYAQTCTKRSNKCINCTEYECLQYRNTTCKKSGCIESECIEWNFKGKCKKTQCVKEGCILWNQTCKVRSKTDCKTCAAYECIQYKDTSECKTYSSTCKTYSTTECATTSAISYYIWYAKPAALLAGAAKVGENISAGGKTFSAPTGSCGESTYESNKCGYSSSNPNIGYGITVVRYEDIYKNGKVKISIKRNDTNQLIKTKDAKFRISDSSNTKIADVTTNLGVVEYELEEGTYKIEEIQSPQGYNLSSDKSVSANIEPNEVTNVEFSYDTTCAVHLEELGTNPTPSALIDLYKKYQNNTNLLNFSEPSCSVATCNEGNLNNTIACLSGAKPLSPTFNENNLSCHDEKVSNAYGIIGFCSNYFSLTNNLNTEKFYGISGKFLIKQEDNSLIYYGENLDTLKTSNKYIATAKGGKICYVLNGNTYDKVSNIKSNNVYFGDVDEDQEADLLDNDVNVSKNSTRNLGTFTMYEYELQYNYNFSKKVYLEKITGQYSSTKTNQTLEEGIYGILSKFNSSNGYIPFSIIYNDNRYMSEKCEYVTKKEIIKYDKNPTGKIELEFRSIDTRKPFVDRDTNTNFCDETGDCSSDNNLVEKIIKNRNNSYNQTGAGPIYRIELTPEDIKNIRKYNNSNNHYYDNYLTQEVTYDGVKKIRNSFLHSLEQGKIGDDYLSNKLYNVKYSGE